VAFDAWLIVAKPKQYGGKAMHEEGRVGHELFGLGICYNENYQTLQFQLITAVLEYEQSKVYIHSKCNSIAHTKATAIEQS